MATPDEFARSAKETARALRRLPAELRRALGREVKDRVAEPLAADIRRRWVGPHARVLSAATKTRVAGDPQVVVGGARRVLSGGGSARDVVFGNEFGGGKRVTAIPARAGRRGHTRHTTRQFAGKRQDAVFGTVSATIKTTFDRWVEVVDEVIDREIP